MFVTGSWCLRRPGVAKGSRTSAGWLLFLVSSRSWRDHVRRGVDRRAYEERGAFVTAHLAPAAILCGRLFLRRRRQHMARCRGRCGRCRSCCQHRRPRSRQSADVRRPGGYGLRLPDVRPDSATPFRVRGLLPAQASGSVHRPATACLVSAGRRWIGRHGERRLARGHVNRYILANGTEPGAVYYCYRAAAEWRITSIR